MVYHQLKLGKTALKKSDFQNLFLSFENAHVRVKTLSFVRWSSYFWCKKSKNSKEIIGPSNTIVLFVTLIWVPKSLGSNISRQLNKFLLKNCKKIFLDFYVLFW
jgi:hypothetical protein